MKANTKKALISIALLFNVVFSLCGVIHPVAAETFDTSFTTPIQAAIAETLSARAKYLGEYVPTAEFVDYENGTTLTIIDYGNGTKRYVTETFRINYASLSLGGTDQTLSLNIPTVEGEATDYLTKTQDVVMGFTVELPSLDWSIEVWCLIDAGVKFEFAFGLRLPVRIDLEYPEVMAVDHDYTLYATITPLDWSAAQFYSAGLSADEHEFLCKFIAKIWLEALHIDIIDEGIEIDESRSFATPLGYDMKFPIPDIPVDLTWLVKVIIGIDISGYLGIILLLEPIVSSDKITAKWSAGGDASGSGTITWTHPGHKVAFDVHTSDYGPTDHAEIELSDFRYFFTIFMVRFKLKIDFRGELDGIEDITVHLFTLDLSFIMGALDLYLGVHSGTVGTMEVSIFVEKFGVDLVVTPTTLDIVPGDTGTYDIEVTNTGNVPDTFAITVEGLPSSWWYELSANEVALAPGGSTHVSLYIEPHRHWSTSPGHYSFTATGASQEAPLRDLVATDTEAAIVHVLPFYEVDVSVTPATILTEPGETGVYTIEVTNLGNVPDRFDISLNFADFDGAYRAVPTSIPPEWTTTDKTFMTLDPGASDIATLNITVPSDWAGMENATYQFTATATSVTDPTASDSESAELTVRATKESMARHVDLQLQRLTDEVTVSGIDDDVRLSLLEKLTNATKKKEQALNCILTGKEKLADNMLRGCEHMVSAFINQVGAQANAQPGKHIPEVLAEAWIADAQQVMTDLETAIATPI